MQINGCNIANKQNKGQEVRDHLSRCRKHLGQNSTSFHDKSPEELGSEGMYHNIQLYMREL
jgi:hypothetical protein